MVVIRYIHMGPQVGGGVFAETIIPKEETMETREGNTEGGAEGEIIESLFGLELGGTS